MDVQSRESKRNMQPTEFSRRLDIIKKSNVMPSLGTVSS